MYKNHLLPHKTQWEGACIWKNLWWTSTCIYFSTCLTPTVSAQSNWCLFTPPTPSLHPRDQQQHAPSPIKAAQGWTREGRVKSDFNRKKLAVVCSVRLFWLTAVYCHYTLTGSCVRWLPENWCSDWQICRTTVHCTYTLNDSKLNVRCTNSDSFCSYLLVCRRWLTAELQWKSRAGDFASVQSILRNDKLWHSCQPVPQR